MRKCEKIDIKILFDSCYVFTSCVCDWRYDLLSENFD